MSQFCAARGSRAGSRNRRSTDNLFINHRVECAKIRNLIETSSSTHGDYCRRGRRIQEPRTENTGTTGGDIPAFGTRCSPPRERLNCGVCGIISLIACFIKVFRLFLQGISRIGLALDIY